MPHQPLRRHPSSAGIWLKPGQERPGELRKGKVKYGRANERQSRQCTWIVVALESLFSDEPGQDREEDDCNHAQEKYGGLEETVEVMVEAVVGIDKGEHQQRGHDESYCAGYAQVFHVLSPDVVKDALQHDEEQNYSLKEKSG